MPKVTSEAADNCRTIINDPDAYPDELAAADNLLRAYWNGTPARIDDLHVAVQYVMRRQRQDRYGK